MAVKYLDNAGTQYLVNKIKAIDGKIPTESQITTMITTALNTYKEGIVTIVESLPQTGEEGKLYLLVDPSDSDVYIIYTWEDNAFKRMGSKTFTLTVDSALSATSTNPVQNKVIKSALDGKANSSHTHGSITNDGKLGTASRVVITGTDKKIGISTITTTQLGYLNGVTSAIQTQLDGKSATGHTHTAGDVAGLATVATTGSYNDLSNKPTINDSTITIQKNGSTVDTFTTNGSAKTINIPVPTKTSDLTNDSNFVDTSNSAVASGITSAKVTDYDAHIADTDIHVTTADKNRWNNNTYVFRYSSTALVASSTNSNTLLDNTDNLKVGDKVIDSSGVLFSITAIDTANSTFTIGTALIDLAKDSDVVHKSGNETISGDKVFNNRLIKNIDVVLGTAPSTGKFSTIEISDNNKYTLLQAMGGVNANGQTYARFAIQNKTADDGTGLSPTGTIRSCGFNINLPASSTSEGQGSITPRANKITDFGLSGYQWRSVWCEKLFLNGTQLDPSAFVTTDTDQTISGSKTFNDLQIIGYGTQYKGARNAYILPEFAAGYSGLSITTMGFAQALKIGNFVLDANNKPSLDTSKAYIQISTGESNGVNACLLESRNSTSSSLGTSANKWSEIHGTEYYYGSNNVEFSQKFVTTDTNQTISGEKIFSNRPIIYNSNATVQADIPNLVFKNPLVERASTTLDGEQTILFTDKNDNNIGSIQAKTYTSGISDIILTSYSEYNGVKTTGIMIRRTPTTSKFQAFSDNITTLGESNRRWKSVYAMSYYYGNDNVEFSNKFVTTDTNQTISGAKTFSDTLTIYNNDSSQNTKNLTISSSKIQVGDTSNSDSFGIVFNAGASYVSRIMAFKDTSGTQNLQFGVRTKDSSNNYIVSTIRSRIYVNGFRTFESDGDNLVSLGSSSNKWKDVQTYKVNALEPSSLGMPDLDNGIDISSYITVNGGNKESLYTPTVNGWISVALTRTGGANMAVLLKQGNFASSGHNIAQENGTTTCNAMLPVKGGVQVSINSALADGIDFAYFYPCLGNV